MPAVKQGFIPDSMSTDLHMGNFTILSMTEVLSKFLARGYPSFDGLPAGGHKGRPYDNTN